MREDIELYEEKCGFSVCLIRFIVQTYMGDMIIYKMSRHIAVKAVKTFE